VWHILSVFVPFIALSLYITRQHPDILMWKNPWMPKQYPYDFYRSYPLDDPRMYPIVNYSFEPAEE